MANNATIDIRGTDDQTPLMEASYYGQLDLVKKLLELGANPSLEIVSGPYSGKTACLMAKIQNATDIVRFFKIEGCFHPNNFKLGSYNIGVLLL